MKPSFQCLLKWYFSYLCKSQNIQMKVSYFYSNQTLRHALCVFDHMKWNISYVSCCFNYNLILSCISTYIFVELEMKPFINVPPMLIFILVCDFFFLSHKFGKKITYLNYLADLGQHLKYDQLNIPQEVIRYVANLIYIASLFS